MKRLLFVISLVAGICHADPAPSYQVIQDNGTNKHKRLRLNFINATVADDSANNRTNVTVNALACDICFNSAADSTYQTGSTRTISIAQATAGNNGNHLYLTAGAGSTGNWGGDLHIVGSGEGGLGKAGDVILDCPTTAAVGECGIDVGFGPTVTSVLLGHAPANSSDTTGRIYNYGHFLQDLTFVVDTSPSVKVADKTSSDATGDTLVHTAGKGNGSGRGGTAWLRGADGGTTGHAGHTFITPGIGGADQQAAVVIDGYAVDVCTDGIGGGIATPSFCLIGKSNSTTVPVSIQSYLQLTNIAAKPTCNSGNRGAIFNEQGGVGAADTIYVCNKDAGGSYAWRSLQ